MKRSIRKILWGICLLSFLFVSACKEETKTCDIDNPLETIDWLKQIKDYFEQNANPVGAQIIQYEYNGECVYWVDSCFGCADNYIIVYNSQQDTICEFGSIAGLNTCPDWDTEATNEVMLFDGT